MAFRADGFSNDNGYFYVLLGFFWKNTFRVDGKIKVYQLHFKLNVDTYRWNN